MIKYKKKIILLCIICYLAFILRVIVFKYPPGISFSIMNANLIPFKTILVYLSGEPTWRVAVYNLLGNILVLVPLGFLFAVFSQSIKWTRVLFIALFTGAILELLQVIFKSGILDIDDIILNFLGVLIGYLFFVVSRYLTNIIKKHS